VAERSVYTQQLAHAGQIYLILKEYARVHQGMTPKGFEAREFLDYINNESLEAYFVSIDPKTKSRGSWELLAKGQPLDSSSPQPLFSSPRFLHDNRISYIVGLMNGQIEVVVVK